MLAKIISGATVGLDAVPVEVEVDVSSRGLPALNIVGLPDKAVQEAKERVRSTILNSGFEMPRHRITVNLAPADLPKALLTICLSLLALSWLLSRFRLM